MATNFFHLATANDTGSAGANACLEVVSVNTAAASAVVTVYNGTATSDPVVAAVDASAKGNYQFKGARCPKGLFVKLTAGNADVTVTYS